MRASMTWWTPLTGRALRRAAVSYHANWRDIVLLLCVLLFTIVWWDVDTAGLIGCRCSSC
jgi:hypothetical protein